MKTFILSFLFLAFCSPIIAQNWKTVATNDTTYFKGGICTGGLYFPSSDSNLLRVIWIDTTIAIGSDSSFSFFKGIRLTTTYPLQQTANDCIDTAAASWLGKSFIRKNDGVEYYFNSYNDTITIRTKANLNDSWRIARDTSGQNYIGTVSSVSLQNVDGVADSVKTITIQAYQNTTPVASYYNSLVLQLSKNHGWLTTLDLYRFPNTNTISNALGTVVDSAQHYRLPSSFKNIDYNTIDLAWKYAPGNEWISKHETSIAPYPGAWKTITYDSVLSAISLSANSMIVTFVTRKYALTYTGTQTGFVPQVATSTTVHTDTITSSLPPLIVKQHIFPEFKQTPMQYYITGLSGYCAGCSRFLVGDFCEEKITIKVRSLLEGAYIHDNGGCWLASPGISGATVSHGDILPGFGSIYNFVEMAEIGPSFYDRTEYTYLKLGPCTRGTKIDVIALGVKEQVAPGDIGLNIYPNPAKDQVTISTPQPLQNAFVSIYDMTGRLLIQQNYPSSNITISTKSLSPGIYLLQLETNTAKQTKKLIVEK